MSEQKQYRLLNPGERVAEGDEYWRNYTWNSAVKDVHMWICDASAPFRRPIEPAGWPEPISIKDKQPTGHYDYPAVLAFDGTKWLIFNYDKEEARFFSRLGTEPYVTHWMELPPNPPVPVKADWEVAFEAFNKQWQVGTGKDWHEVFKAGYLAAQAQKGKG